MRAPIGAVARSAKGRAAFLHGTDPLYGLGDTPNPGANCDYGVLRTINFDGHNIQICRQRFDDALARARYAYIDSNNLWQSQGCVRNGIYYWPAVDASEYSQTPAAAVLSQTKATYPGDHGTIYVFGSHRDDSCLFEQPPAPFNPWGGLSPENWTQASGPAAGGPVTVPAAAPSGSSTTATQPTPATPASSSASSSTSGYSASAIAAAVEAAGPLGIPLWGWGIGVAALAFVFLGGRR